MNIEAFREYCLSLGDVEEKLPFAKMPGGDTVLAFYVNSHTFCYCDIDDFKTVIVKCQPERIPELIETTEGICQPDSHFNAKYWIGLEVQVIDAETLKALVANSYEIVRTKYKRKPMKHTLFSFFLFFVFFPMQTIAQNISFYAGMSKTLYDSRYYPALFGEGVAPSFPTFDVKVGWADFGSSPYASICKHPERGIGFQVDGLYSITAANGPGMGNIYSIYGYIDRTLLAFGDFSFGYSGEFGLGFMFSHRYDPVENPWNVVISSPVNAHISLGFQAKYDITPRFDAGIGFFFNHHSNGAITFPNYGLNAFELALRLGMKSPKNTEEIHRETVDDGFKRRFSFGIQASCGIMSNEASYERHLEEEGVWVNERYFKYAFEANAFYRYCRTHATGLGFDFFVTPFCDKIAENDGRGETYDPFSYGFSLQHELSYYNFSTIVGVGRYLHHHDGLARNKTFYQLVTVKYRFPQLGNMYMGIILKAHKFKAAECIQICIGKEFN